MCCGFWVDVDGCRCGCFRLVGVGVGGCGGVGVDG